MNKPLIAATLCALTIAGALAKGKSSTNDPVLMTIAGKDVTLSEFEYLYNKNNAQQLQPQTLDEYVDMFVTYKLKVADAEAAGIDTTAAFIKEFEGYRADLATPYLSDKAYEDSLLHAAYDRTKVMADISHIMLPPSAPGTADNMMRLDSLRTLIATGARTFESVAEEFSVDGGSNKRGGHMGYITSNRFPAEFEEIAFSTPQGQLSPVFSTNYGYHLIRNNGSKPNPGVVHARHILLATRGLSDSDKAARKQMADSLYTAIINGENFGVVAMQYSDDKATAVKGGELPWFGKGQMVAEFDSVAFALPDSAISRPFATQFGYHIVEKLGHKSVGTYEESLPALKKSFERNNLKSRIEARSLNNFKRQYPATVNDKALSAARDVIINHNGVDSAAIAELLAINTPLITLDSRNITVADIAKTLPTSIAGKDAAVKALQTSINRTIDVNTLSTARRRLAESNVDYRNLLGEYRDGMLLYEISNRNVWERASNDAEGLENYFKENRANYTWQQPHYKGYVVMAPNDSLSQAARGFLADKTLTGDELVSALKEKFGKEVKVERVVTAKGDNAIVDYVAFNGPYPLEIRNRSYWKAWIPYQGRIIDQPEEAADVKGAVSTDYQQQLENRWIEDLHKKYPVKINRKVLKKVK